MYKECFRRVFQVRITDEKVLRWEGREIKWKAPSVGASVPTSQDDLWAGQDSPDSCIKQQRLRPAAGFIARSRRFSAHAAQDHTGQTHHQSFDCRKESRTEKYTCVDARLSFWCSAAIQWRKMEFPFIFQNRPSVIQVFLTAEFRGFAAVAALKVKKMFVCFFFPLKRRSRGRTYRICPRCCWGRTHECV